MTSALSLRRPKSPLLYVLVLFLIFLVTACAHEMLRSEENKRDPQVSLLSAETGGPPVAATTAAAPAEMSWAETVEDDPSSAGAEESLTESVETPERDIASVPAPPPDSGAFRLGPIFWSLIILALFGLGALFFRGRKTSGGGLT